jgi:ubiquitin-protein ligase
MSQNRILYRVFKELTELYDKYGNASISMNEKGQHEISFIDKRQNEILFTNKKNNKNREYKIILPVNYPFEAPYHVFVNQINYRDIKKIYSLKLLSILDKKCGKKCLCCHSILCSSNWSPSIMISKVIEEINEFINIKKKIVIYSLHRPKR